MQIAQPSKLSVAVLQLALLIGIIVVLYFGQGFLLPLVAAALLAMVLNPLHEKFLGWGWPNGLAIAGSVGVLLLFFAGLFAAIGQQAASFADNWPETKERISTQVASLREAYKLESILPKVPVIEESKKSSTSAPSETSSMPVSGGGIMGFISGTFGILGDFFLMLIYVILLLSQKDRLREFVLRVAPDEKRGLTHQTLNESRDIVQNYLRGYMILIGILSTLYSIGFLISGLDYAVLVAVLAATLSLIPYLGNIIGGLFALALAYSSGGDISAVYGVLITMGLAQLLENYVITPMVIGDEVDLNPLVTIICVVGMSILWGPVGAIVAIPIFAILRIVCSHVDGLRDYAYLLGQK